MSSKPKNIEELNPPEEFYKIVNDFIADIIITFPEYTGLISRWWTQKPDITEDRKKNETLFVFRHCVKTIPERFFDILYKNTDIIATESEVNTEFLPGIVFKQLWTYDISDKTRETVWKYLQLILFAVIGSVHSTSELGDTAKLFDNLNEDELKKKLQETLEGMQGIFEENKTPSEQIPLPNADKIHEHIHSMMTGKLGKLAMELAEETAQDLNLDMENITDAKDVFQQLLKNPAKMMNMVKNVGSKMDERIKSGEIKESELMEEGMQLLNKMKDMPGMGDMQKIFSQMGLPGLGKGAKLNMGAMEAKLNQNMKNSKLKERLRAKADANAKAREEQLKTAFTNMDATDLKPEVSEEEILKIFSTGEKVERTPRGTKAPESGKKKKSKK